MGIAEQLAEQAQLAKEKIGGLNSNIQQLPKSVSEEIIIELSSISDTDMITMNSLPEFIEANNLYNQHFQLFLLNKFREDFRNKGMKNFDKDYNGMDKSRRYSDQSYSHNQMNMRQGDEKGYCDLRMMEHVKEHGYHLDKEMLECGLLLLDFEDHEEPWTVEETERARKNNGLHFNGEYSSVNKYDFNFIMNKKKAKDKYEGRSINELAYKSYESLTDDSFPYPEAKAYFIFLTYLYSTMAEKHKLFNK